MPGATENVAFRSRTTTARRTTALAGGRDRPTQLLDGERHELVVALATTASAPLDTSDSATPRRRTAAACRTPTAWSARQPEEVALGDGPIEPQVDGHDRRRRRGVGGANTGASGGGSGQNAERSRARARRR
jgi:hypothetical protein